MDQATPSPVSTSMWAFFARTVAWFVLCTVVWMQVSAWTSYPVAQLAHFTLNLGADYWVRKVHVTPGSVEVDTRIEVVVSQQPGANGKADLVAQADPARYGYGLSLFIALLLASRSRNWLKRALVGYIVLWIPQTFSLVLELLRQMVVTGGSARALVIDQWQMEAIAMGYQVGSLLLPTLAPVMLWLWLERDGFAKTLWTRLTEVRG